MPGGRPRGSYNRNKKALQKAWRRRTAPLLTWKQNPDNVIYSYKQYADIGATAVLSSTGAGIGYAFTFILSSLPNSVNFTSLYDEYRIRSIEVTFRPQSIVVNDLGTSQLGTVNNSGHFIYAVDHDDDLAPTSYNQIREYGSAKEVETLTGKKHKVIIKPCIQTEVQQSVGVTALSRKQSPWVDCAYNQIKHFGLKVFLPPTTINNQLTVLVSVRMLVDFRQVR